MFNDLNKNFCRNKLDTGADFYSKCDVKTMQILLLMLRILFLSMNAIVVDVGVVKVVVQLKEQPKKQEDEKLKTKWSKHKGDDLEHHLNEAKRWMKITKSG